MSPTLAIRLVSPRLEPVTDIGVEVQIEEIARRLSGRGHQVEVLTTCVRDDVTWKNHYSPGLTEKEGFTVRRVPADPRRVTRRSLEVGWRLERGERVPSEDQEMWLRSLGYSTALRDHIIRTKGEADVTIFAPALSGATLSGLPEAGPSLLIAALRDRPSARLEALRGLLRGATKVLAASEAERALIEEVAGIPAREILLSGAAVAPAEEYRPERFRDRHGLEVPFLMYAGRRRPEKGLPRLLEYMAVLVTDGGFDLRLVLLGSELPVIPERVRHSVLDLHTIQQQDKADGMAAALALCQPSPTEGLALAPLETWLAGRPVLADARGSVTRERCRESGGGIWYESYQEFEEAVKLLLENERVAEGLGSQGRKYVQDRWSWDQTIDDIEKACNDAAGETDRRRA